MKLLFLSLCGRNKEDEDVKYLNLYFASLQRHVVSHFNTQVFLFSTFNSTERTKARVAAFGLADVVQVCGYPDMELPADTAKILQDNCSPFLKIGLNMNMMFDYAKQRQFFGADWIFHTDTDIEFLDNFSLNMTGLQGMTAANPKIIVSCAGDTYPHNLRYKDREYIFSPPVRWNAYTEALPLHIEKLFVMQTELRPTHCHQPFRDEHRLVYNYKSMKVRNDFVGLSREAAVNELPLNWVHTYYNLDHNTHSTNDVSNAVHTLWKKHQENITLPLMLHLNEDKGSIVLFLLKSGAHNFTWVQLRAHKDMANHYNSGWNTDQRFNERALVALKAKYSDTAHVWGSDYHRARRPIWGPDHSTE